MATIQQLEEEVNKIKERNKRVEVDKAWETSGMRKLVIALLTYIIISLFFAVSGFPNPLISAIVPTTGFLLSTLSISLLKKIWVKYIYKE